MWPYWFLFLVPATLALSQIRPMKVVNRTGAIWPGKWIVAFVAITLMVGLRYQVGGDWGNYERNYLNMLGAPLQEALEQGDPGYYLLVWLAGKVNGGVYLVNLVSSALFSLGLFVFCRQQPRPWLALAVAVPYMVLVLGMGYTRQGVALGLALLGMVGLARQSNLKFVLFVALAATFHKSAVLLVPLAVLATPRSRLWTALWVGISAVLLYWVLLADSVDALITSYVEAQYQSEGAAVRIAMNAVPAALLLVLRKRVMGTQAERNLWTMMALAALVTVAVLLVSPSSTAVDRVALYLLPLQLFVFARLPDLLSQGTKRRTWVLAVLGYYAVVLFVWLSFATHSRFWLPYQFYPLVGL